MGQGVLANLAANISRMGCQQDNKWKCFNELYYAKYNKYLCHSIMEKALGYCSPDYKKKEISLYNVKYM